MPTFERSRLDDYPILAVDDRVTQVGPADIVAGATVNEVIAVDPIDGIQHVAPATAPELISSAPSEERIPPSSAAEHVDARPPVQVIAARPTVEYVVPGSRTDQIVARPTAQDVGIRCARQHVITIGSRLGAHCRRGSGRRHRGRSRDAEED